MQQKVPNQQGLGKQVKRLLPRSVFRQITRTYNACAALVPAGVKYGLGGWARRGKYPYCIIQSGDLVVQVGAPRDLVIAGRSRAIHFARLVGDGRVVVVEPDADSVATMRAFLEADPVLKSRVTVVPLGAWSERTELRFMLFPDHPASNQIQQVMRPDIERHGGIESVVQVDSLDSILAELKLSRPKLVSITTNGAEVQILDGMRRTIAEGCPYISLATSIDRYHQAMDRLGYEYIARDDRGACYQQRQAKPAGQP